MSAMVVTGASFRGGEYPRFCETVDVARTTVVVVFYLDSTRELACRPHRRPVHAPPLIDMLCADFVNHGVKVKRPITFCKQFNRLPYTFPTSHKGHK